ncbi:MAG: YkgJ family cysteine cluster protein [Bacteroidota bacterium]
MENNQPENHQCRPLCGACCIAPSISSPIPGMPKGKASGVRCIQLTDDLLCKLIDSPLRPKVCEGFKFDKLICGSSQLEATKIMEELES